MRSVLTHEPARAEAAVVEVLTENEESIYWFAMLYVEGKLTCKLDDLLC